MIPIWYFSSCELLENVRFTISIYMDWYPQAPLKAFQACRSLFVFDRQHTLLKSVNDCQSLSTFKLVCQLLKAPNRRGMQFHAELLSKFVLSSHLDPIGLLFLSQRLHTWSGSDLYRPGCTQLHETRLVTKAMSNNCPYA